MKEASVVKELIVTKERLTPKSATVTFCPGCGYGVVWRVMCQVLDEMGLEDRAIAVGGGGCFGRGGALYDIDKGGAMHGRGAPSATAIKRLVPEALVFTVQGDGDLLAIGAGHFLNVMMRAEKITTVFLNNAGYGMTGGQYSPTTPVGMRTTTTPAGRDPAFTGFPVHAAELAASMKGTAYSARVSVHTAANFQRAKKALSTAFQKQLDGIGYSFVEFISACPTDWRLSPVESMKFIDEKMLKEFPLGEFKNVDSIDYSIGGS